MNEVKRTNDLMEIVEKTAFNVATISEQIGMVATEVRALKLENMKIKEEMSSGFQKIGNRIRSYEDRIRVTRQQAQNIRNAIHQRAAVLLNIYYKDGTVADECLYADKHYRSGFIFRIYVDARNQSRLGTPYYETYQKDVEEVLNYINSWIPPTGVEGYKAYLDKRREER